MGHLKQHRKDETVTGRGLNLSIVLCAFLGLLLLIVPPLTSCNDPQTPQASPSATQPPPSPTATATATPTPDPTPAAAEAVPSAAEPPPEPAPAALPQAAAPVRINYAAAGFDVAVHPLAPDARASVTRTLNPPETLDGYWLSPYGVPGAGSSDTTYIIGHSWTDRDAPFNQLSTRAKPGDVFDVITQTGTIQYRVDSVDTYDKDTLKDSPIWNIVPNQLVLVSCYTKDFWGTNVTVTATPVAL